MGQLYRILDATGDAATGRLGDHHNTMHSDPGGADNHVICSTDNVMYHSGLDLYLDAQFDPTCELDEYELNAAVAECLMGRKRGHCYSTIGGGNTSGSGQQQETHTWFTCQWCGRMVEDGRGGGPCPKYPFSKIGILELMKALGERGLHVLVRYDPLRERNNWTVMVGQADRTDTDDPLHCLKVQAQKTWSRWENTDGAAIQDRGSRP